MMQSHRHPCNRTKMTAVCATQRQPARAVSSCARHLAIAIHAPLPLWCRTAATHACLQSQRAGAPAWPGLRWLCLPCHAMCGNENKLERTQAAKVPTSLWQRERPHRTALQTGEGRMARGLSMEPHVCAHRAASQPSVAEKPDGDYGRRRRRCHQQPRAARRR